MTELYEKVLKFVEETEIIFPSKIALEPISDALLVFTDGSSNGTSVVYIKDRPTISKRNFCTAGGNFCNYYCPWTHTWRV